MNKFTESQLNWLHTSLGKSFAVVANGVVTNAHTGEIIPSSLLYQYSNPRKDGQYELCEMTCGGSLTNGRGGKFKDTPENREKFQCRIGRRAPKCTAYSPSKCAIYQLEQIGRYSESISIDKLIALANVS
ncbi:hypothetical protein NVP1081O_222 [Vibrio phage 1.081.O._10N.286.52.C2]|nr:hypothetical protein NVP1081O_222 [Vibrio phage 1.081.O._10N.286.52.C2]